MNQVNELEIKCISRVWDYYYKKISGHESQDIPISLLIIKLMSVLKKSKNKDLIAKALLLAISFFHHILPGDIYDHRGIDIEILPREPKKKVIELLRQEFLLN